MSTTTGNRQRQARPHERGTTAFIALVILLLGGVIFISVFAEQFTDQPPRSVGSVAMLLAGASLAVGGLVGFLFGIPRTHRAAEVDETTGGATREAVGVEYRGNTNLEDVSDWLTKILVGVGLIQLTSIVDRLEAATTQLKPLLGNGPASGLFGVAVIVFYSTSGFLLGFLWTRIYLPKAYRWSDLEQLEARVGVLDQQVAENQQRVDELSGQARRDARALDLVRRQLSATSAADEIAQNELEAAVAEASRIAQTLAFNEAWIVRKDNARMSGDKARLARTIPVFRALVAADREKNDFEVVSQLGYALKDMDPPAWSEAQEALTEAIRIRDKLGVQGWRLFEFNRAICRINQDPGLIEDPPRKATEDVRNAILNDLRATADDRYVFRLISAQDPSFGSQPAEWLRINGIDPTTLRERS